MNLENFCNFNAILNVFSEDKNIASGINPKLYYLLSGSSVYKIKIIYSFGQEVCML